MTTTLLPQIAPALTVARFPETRLDTCVDDDSHLLVARAGARQREQLPSFSPLLDEIELAGYTDPPASGKVAGLATSFHDWFPLSGGRMLVAVGQTTGEASRDPLEGAMVAQMVWTATRCHARQVDDAGRLLSLVANTIGMSSAGGTAASLAVALVDPLGTVNYAAAGNCLMARVRAATCELLPISPTCVGVQPDAAYMDYSLELRPRERLVFRSGQLSGDAIANHFSGIPAESHRAMSAKETIKHMRAIHAEQSAMSMAVVRRR